MNGMFVPTRICIMAFEPSRSDAQSFEMAALEDEIEDHAREQHRGEHVRHQAVIRRDGETLDGAGAELEEEQRADDGGDVGVENGAERPVVTELDRLSHALSVAEFL